MNAAELHRKLLYKGHTELSAFLEESPYNYELYQLLRDVKPRYEVNASMASILSEVYYLCIRASRDLTPGDNIVERYVSEELAWTGNNDATELTFCMVYLVLSMQKDLSYPLQTFRQTVRTLYAESKFMPEVNDFLVRQKINEKRWDTDFTPQPVAATDLPSYTEPSTESILFGIINDTSPVRNPWRVVTNGYAQSHILNFLRCYHTRDEQLILIDRIQESAEPHERMEMEAFYAETRELIHLGEYLPRMVEKPVKQPSADDRPSELAIAYQQIEALKHQIEDLEHHYTTKLSQQRADFDRSMARREAQFRQELEAALQSAHEEIQDQAAPAEPSLTIVEMVGHAKAQCTPQGGSEVACMLYRFVGEHGFVNEQTMALIGSIVPAINQRVAVHQTFDMPHVSQFNNNPSSVNNYGDQD